MTVAKQQKGDPNAAGPLLREMTPASPLPKLGGLIRIVLLHVLSRPKINAILFTDRLLHF